MKGFVAGALAQTSGPHPSVQGWYAWFLQQMVLPNAALFAYVVTFEEVLVGLERRSSNGELTRRGKTWFAQEKRRSKQNYATSALATPSRIVSGRRTSGQTCSQSETFRIYAEVSSLDL